MSCISGMGTSEIKIKDKDSLNKTSHRVLSDRIKAGPYMFAIALLKMT